MKNKMISNVKELFIQDTRNSRFVPATIGIVDETKRSFFENWKLFSDHFKVRERIIFSINEVTYGLFTKIPDLKYKDFTFEPIQLQAFLTLSTYEWSGKEYPFVSDFKTAPWNSNSNKNNKDTVRLFSGSMTSLFYHIIKLNLGRLEEHSPILVDIESCFGEKEDYINRLGLRIKGAHDVLYGLQTYELYSIGGGDPKYTKEEHAIWVKAYEETQLNRKDKMKI